MGRVRKRYPREFKLEAVKQMQSGKYNTTELARRLGVQEHDLREWRKQVEAKQDGAFPGQGRRIGEPAQIEKLRRELKQVKEERDILKKAVAFFARESR